jgi:Immunity protein Imm1
MRKCAYLDLRRGNGWPKPAELERYFLGPPRQRWAFESGNDNAGLAVEGVDGTEDMEPNEGRVDVDLDMWGHPDLGVLLIYSKWGDGAKEMCSSKGDLRRLHERFRSKQGTLLPVGLFIPHGTAWKAVKEFMEADGELPTSIDWIDHRHLPRGTFSDRPTATGASRCNCR